MLQKFLAGDLGDGGTHLEMELMHSVLFILEFETLEEKHLVGEIHAVGYTGVSYRQ